MKTKKPKLIPPDLDRCQAEKKVGCHPDAQHFMIIGPAGMERCKSKPHYIVCELKAGKDGLKGSMSLCSACLAVFIDQNHGNVSDFKITALSMNLPP